MTIIEYVLIGIIFTYTIFFVSCNLSIIFKYHKCRKSGSMKIANGKICEKVNEEKKACNGKMIYLSYPKYEYERSGEQEKKYIVSVVRQKDVVVGQQNEIGYCEENNDAWVISEMPIVKRNLLVKTVILLGVMLVFVATSLLV